MSYTRRMRRSLLAVFFITLFSLAADATTVVPLSFEQLVNESQSVVYGRVADVRAQWTDDRRFIESVVTVEILRGMKGSAGESIAFTVPGGQVGRYLNVIPGAPSFAPGDLAVFFLTAQGPRLPVDDRTHAGHLSRPARSVVRRDAGRAARDRRCRPRRARRCAPQAGVVVGVRRHGAGGGRRAMRQCVAVTLTVLLTIGSSSPLAYLKLGAMVNGRVIDATWNQQPIGYFVSDRPGSGVSAIDLRGAVERATATWSRVESANVRFAFQGMTSAPAEGSMAGRRSGFSIAPISIACSAPPAS